MKKTVAGLLLILALTGCSSTVAASTPTPTPEESYSTVAELRDAFEDAGGDCSEFEQTNNITLSAQSADCNSTTVISVYTSESNRDQVVSNVQDLMGDKPLHLLVGKNWIINVEDPEAYVDGLGGVVVTK